VLGRKVEDRPVSSTSTLLSSNSERNRREIQKSVIDNEERTMSG